MQLLSSESITYGHPDRLCDAIGNNILNEFLKQDPASHVGLEALATENYLTLSGEVSSQAKVNVDKIARDVAKSIGYGPKSGFDPDTITIVDKIAKQSPDIAQGVDHEDGSVGAGDQGIITGYATSDTPLGIDVPAMAANLLTFAYQEYQKIFSFLHPDAKSQVTYDPEAKVITHVVMAVSHDEDVELEDLRKQITEELIMPVLHLVAHYCPGVTFDNPKIIVNGTGKFTIFGPQSDCGVIGRKLAVDSYGGYAPLGGGNTNAKDPSKVDASAARAARHLALNLVFAGICDKALIKLSYCIGHADPISVALELTKNGQPVDQLTLAKVTSWVEQNYSFAVQEIINRLDLTHQDYSQISRTGQFGLVGSEVFSQLNKGDELIVPSWEKLDLVSYLRPLV